MFMHGPEGLSIVGLEDCGLKAWLRAKVHFLIHKNGSVAQLLQRRAVQYLKLSVLDFLLRCLRPW